jgi:putative membrane protein insertion efficiency factor
VIARWLLALVAFYRRYLSPLKGQPTCRFLPTCSAYAQEALVTHGAWRGTWLTCWRICRCHPFARGGLDPVPPRELALAASRKEELDGRLG